MNPTLLGEGALTWNRSERVSDRYGAFYLITSGGNNTDNGDFVPWQHHAPVGAYGKLVATILETRKSTHIGDFFRQIKPSTPTVGDRIILGEGYIFYEPEEDGCQPLGLLPRESRDSDWLDPHALYRCHEQTVRIEFVPTAE